MLLQQLTQVISMLFGKAVLIRLQTPVGLWLFFNTDHTISHLLFWQFLVVRVVHVIK